MSLPLTTPVTNPNSTSTTTYAYQGITLYGRLEYLNTAPTVNANVTSTVPTGTSTSS